MKVILKKTKDTRNIIIDGKDVDEVKARSRAPLLRRVISKYDEDELVEILLEHYGKFTNIKGVDIYEIEV